MKILVFDTETTGLNHKRDDVIEFGGCIFDLEENIIKEFSMLFKTNIRMSQEVVSIHGITNQQLDDNGFNFSEKIEEIIDILNCADVYVGHNLEFDINFMKEMLERRGKSLPEKPTIDTLDIAYRYIPKNESKRSLGLLCKWAQVPLENAHRALDDAIACGKLLFVLSKRLDISIEEFANSQDSPSVGVFHIGEDPFVSQFSGNRTSYKD